MRRLCNAVRAVIFATTLFTLPPGLVAQVPDTWQPVPHEDLLLKDNPAVPGSSAMILERSVYFDDEKRLEKIWYRIKIFTEEGRAYSDIQIPYLEKYTAVEDIRGRTVQPDGIAITFNGSVYDDVVVKYKKFKYQVKAFTLPGVKVGSVIEYAYTLRWKQKVPDYIRNPFAYQFEHGWTIQTATWTIQHELFTRHALFVLRPVKGRLGFATVRLPGSQPSTQPDGTVRMEVTNISAIDKEEYMPPESMLTSRVHFYYLAGLITDSRDYWRQHGSIQAKQFDKFIEKTLFLEQQAREIAPSSDPPETRLRKLYARVQQIRDISDEPSRTQKEIEREHLAENKSAEDVLRHGYGYGNEINFLFNALAGAAGFEASIVEIVDRSSAIFEKEVLDASQLNAMVVLVKLNGQHLYLDPASRFCPFGLLPWFESDTQGIKWDKNWSTLVTIRPPANDLSTIDRSADLRLGPDGAMEGTLEIAFTGQEALDRRLQAADEDDLGRRKLVEDEVKEMMPPGATIKVQSITGWEDPEKPLSVKCRVNAPRFAVLTRERMLFPLGLFQVNNNAVLTHGTRVYPVYFRHSYSTVDKVAISLPTGYQVEAVPSDAQVVVQFAEFSEKYASEAGRVRMDRRAAMNGYYFRPETYRSLRQYFQQLRQADAQHVVLHREKSQADR